MKIYAIFHIFFKTIEGSFNPSNSVGLEGLCSLCFFNVTPFFLPNTSNNDL